MKLLAVNVSLPREITAKGKTVRTGIFKEPVDRRVQVETLNIVGDGQADLIGHGGEMRAVLVYSFDNYAHWETELGRTDFRFGQFGENFTVEGMLDDEIHVGDRFRIGAAVFEVSQPRVPCYKLAIKMNHDGFYDLLLQHGRPGFYFRVLKEGEVGAGDTIHRMSAHPVAISVRQMSNLLYFEKDDLDGARRALQIEALSPGWRQSFENRLTKAKLAATAREPLRSLVVERKVGESENVISFYLVPEDGRPLAPFLPGQFLPLKLDIPGQYQPVVRTYSLSDSPSANHYRLTIKRETAPPDRPDAYPGAASNFFHDQVDVGSKVLAQSPRGRFLLDPSREHPVVLLSGGIGLTPLVSMLTTIVESGSRCQTWFIHGARNGREHAMGDLVRQLSDGHDHIRTHVRYSRPFPEDTVGRDYDDEGHVDIRLLERLLPDQHFDFYLCGPTPFMKSLFDGLMAWGIPADRIHYEFFGPASALTGRAHVSTPKRVAAAVECCGETEVTFSKAGVTANWNASFESLLDLAEASGLSPDYSCRSGICQTCACPLEEGEVDYVLEPLEPPDPGSVLICCSKPKTDRVVLGI